MWVCRRPLARHWPVADLATVGNHGVVSAAIEEPLERTNTDSGQRFSTLGDTAARTDPSSHPCAGPYAGHTSANSWRL